MKLAKFLLLCTTAALTIAAPIAKADALADIAKAGSVRIAVPQDVQPYGSVNSDLQLQGLDIDVAKLIAKNLGVKVVFVPVTITNRIPYLLTHKADLVISTLGRSAEREKVIDFSQSYAPYNNSLFGPADIKVSVPADMANQTVGVTRGTFEDILLTKTLPSSTVFKRYEDNNTLISAYLSGQIRMIGTGDYVAVTLGERDPQHKPLLKYVIQESRCVVGLNKGEPALQAKINDILTKAKKSGELNTLVQKWLNVPLSDKIMQDLES